MEAVLEERVREVLKTVYDAEMGINIIDLGVVYGIEQSEDGKRVKITYTLTTPARPLEPMLKMQIEEALSRLESVEEVEAELVFSPPWDPHEMCSDEAKFELGIF